MGVTQSLIPFQFPFPIPQQQQYYPSNSGGSNRNNFRSNRNQFPQSQKPYSSQPNFSQSGGCQICGKTNHLAYACYHRLNLDYRPMGRLGSGNSYNSGYATQGQGMSPRNFRMPSGNFSQPGMSPRNFNQYGGYGSASGFGNNGNSSYGG